jgi:mitochondrial fission protein ELM1
MAALWIQQQSGGRSKIILLGRPKRWRERFALIIVPSQYRMPAQANVVQLDLPLLRANEEKIAAAGAAWRERLTGLPRPLTALLVGGRCRRCPCIAN